MEFLLMLKYIVTETSSLMSRLMLSSGITHTTGSTQRL